MSRSSFMLPIFIALLIAGCSPKSEPTPSTTPTPEPKKEAAAETEVKSPFPTELENQKPDPKAKPQVAETGKEQAIDASLKHDGYTYLGLGSNHETKIKVASTELTTSSTQKCKLISVSKDRLVYEQSYTGKLAAQGKLEYIVTKDGVYARQLNDLVKDNKAVIQLPAKLDKGIKWKTTESFANGPSVVKVESSSEVIGPEKIKVGKKEYDAILIEGTGTMSGGLSGTIKTRSWFVKGVGNVKNEIERTVNGAPPVKVTVTME